MDIIENKQKYVPMVSVIIAVYNEEKRLDKCIHSVIDQIYQNFEIIIVNDGSTDGSAEIIQKYVDAYGTKIVGINKENGGQGSARNRGIDIAGGKYITFLDSDDYIEKDYLQILVSTAEKYECDMVCSGQHKVKEDGEIVDSILYKAQDGKCLTRRLNISGKLYLTSYIKENDVSFPEGKTYEDNSFNLQMFFLTNKIYFLEYAGYYQVVHEGSTTSKVIKPEALPFEEWDNCINKVLKHSDTIDLQLFEFTFLSFLAYLLFVRIRKREYLSNKDRESNIRNAVVIARSFQKITNTYFFSATKNKYTRLFPLNELPLTQKLGTRVFLRMCIWNKLESFTKILYRLI